MMARLVFVPGGSLSQSAWAGEAAARRGSDPGCKAADKGSRRQRRRSPGGRHRPCAPQGVKHHDVARLERRRQELLDIGTKGGPVHRSVEHQGCHDTALPEAGEEDHGLPMAVRHSGDQTLFRRARGHNSASCS